MNKIKNLIKPSRVMATINIVQIIPCVSDNTYAIFKDTSSDNNYQDEVEREDIERYWLQKVICYGLIEEVDAGHYYKAPRPMVLCEFGNIEPAGEEYYIGVVEIPVFRDPQKCRQLEYAIKQVEDNFAVNISRDEYKLFKSH